MAHAPETVSLYIRPDENARLARLFVFLELGEYLSRDCAYAQAELATPSKARRFLRSQAHQEAFHAKVFHEAARMLAPRPCARLTSESAMQRFREHMEDALMNRRYSETLLAQQIILEGLGEVTLAVLDEGMNKRNMPFRSMRRILLRQEHAHHRFGIESLNQQIAEQAISRQSLRQCSHKYLDACEAMLDELGGLFDFFDEDPVTFRGRFYATLPEWLIA